MIEPHLNFDSANISANGDESLPVTFESWVGSRNLTALGTNAGANALAFQGWRHFKEAFAPEFIARAVRECERPVTRCFDPFGGSGTTALACQFLGIHPVTIEVNPYLSDLIEAKLSSYNLETLARDAGFVIEYAQDPRNNTGLNLTAGPQTLIEPGRKNQWVFDKAVAQNILSLRAGIEKLENEENKRLFRVILGGQLVDLSNVRINGKGRRYRSGWRGRPVPPDRVFAAFVEALTHAVHDIVLHRGRANMSYDLRRGDTRNLAREIEPVDLVVFSPPYPNSFDYTDVYNLELWMLGYLQAAGDNAALRAATLTSHVQLRRTYIPAPTTSALLTQVLEQLEGRRDKLWHRDIPAMIGGYFADLEDLLKSLQGKLNSRGRIYMVVGDSQYAGVLIPVADILVEIAAALGFEILDTEASRSMRVSAQQGGAAVLPETMLVLA